MLLKDKSCYVLYFLIIIKYRVQSQIKNECTVCTNKYVLYECMCTIKYNIHWVTCSLITLTTYRVRPHCLVLPCEVGTSRVFQVSMPCRISHHNINIAHHILIFYLVPPHPTPFSSLPTQVYYPYTHDPF